jgi:carboxyl-terminal processing protease
MRRYFRIAFYAATALSCLLSAFLIGQRSAPAREVDDVIDAFRTLGLEPKSRAEFRAAALEAVVTASGDQYAHYLSPVQYREQIRLDAGVYVGIGVTRNVADFARITAVTAGGPAARAGLLAGDLIVAVDGDAAKARTSDALDAAIAGRRGTVVVVTVSRGDARLDVAMTRRLLEPGRVKHKMLEDRLGRIQIPYFGDHTAEQVHDAITALTRSHARALVLDLQNCPGGQLGKAAQVAQLFLGKGTVLQLQTRAGHKDVTFDKPALTRLPLAVLVDEKTGSAAEMVALALRDRHRGPVIGVTTYGKAKGQLTLPLDDGAAVMFSTASWYGPTGASTDGKGVEPTIRVDDPHARLERARAELR